MDKKRVKESSQELFVPNNGILQVEVDIPNKTVTFINISNSHRSSVKLSGSLMNEPLRLYAMMREENASVEFVA